MLNLGVWMPPAWRCHGRQIREGVAGVEEKLEGLENNLKGED